MIDHLPSKDSGVGSLPMPLDQYHNACAITRTEPAPGSASNLDLRVGDDACATLRDLAYLV